MKKTLALLATTLTFTTTAHTQAAPNPNPLSCSITNEQLRQSRMASVPELIQEWKTLLSNNANSFKLTNVSGSLVSDDIINCDADLTVTNNKSGDTLLLHIDYLVQNNNFVQISGISASSPGVSPQPRNQVVR